MSCQNICSGWFNKVETTLVIRKDITRLKYCLKGKIGIKKIIIINEWTKRTRMLRKVFLQLNNFCWIISWIHLKGAVWVEVGASFFSVGQPFEFGQRVKVAEMSKTKHSLSCDAFLN